MKKYLVFMQDEYNNNYYLGIYKDLQNSIKDINEWLELYNVTIDELTEHLGTFDSCFDREIETESGYVFVRGFILDDEHLKELD